MRIRRTGMLVVGLLVTSAMGAAAQQAGAAGPRWTFRTSALIAGSSHDSDPAGYKSYGAVALEVGLRRTVTRVVALELTARTESREVDSLAATAPDRRLGSLELVPVSLLMQFRPPWHGALHPYAGAGVNVTTAWEKSGALDSLDVSASIGPVVQIGLDLDLAPTVLLNADARWTRQRTEITTGGARVMKLDVDPVALGLGLGFRF